MYDWWFRGTAAIHHASGGSDAGFELSCQVSGGGGSKGLIGCPEKFNEAGQRRLWESLSNDGFRIRSDAVTIDTIYWIAGRYCGWKRGRHGRPLGQPREIKLSEQAEAVADAGRRAVSAGLDRVRELHADVCAPLFQGDPLLGRVVAAIYDRLEPRTGVAFIGSLAGMAGTLDCARETLRRYLRVLARKGLIIKNAGNAASMLGTPGITVALALPERLWEAVNPQQSTATPDPPIADTTGITTPHFQTQAGWNLSRSPYSHEDDDAQGLDGTRRSPQTGDGKGDAGSEVQAALWSKPDPTLGDWTEAGVIHAEFEFGDHLERLADERGKGAVSRVLERLKDLRTIRNSPAEIRSDAERAADLAARTVAKKVGKRMGFTEADIKHMVEHSSPGSVDNEDAADFVREMANELDVILSHGGAQARLADQASRADEVLWPRLTIGERGQLKRWIREMPEAVANHCSLSARRRGLTGSVAHLVEVLQFANRKMDGVALHLVMEDAARRITFRGPDKLPADLAKMSPGECLGRFLRKLVEVLGDNCGLPETPGYAAIKGRAKFISRESPAAKPNGNKHVAARHKRDPSAFS